MMKTKPWTEAENNALWALYFAMLDRAMAGEAYSKAAMIRDYRGTNAKLPNIRQDFPLHNRSKGSLEFKLMNATACHASILCGGDWDSAPTALASTMHERGYRAMPNYQAALKVAYPTNRGTSQ